MTVKPDRRYLLFYPNGTLTDPSAGIASVGMLYGLGDIEELTCAGADFIAEDIYTLRNLLLGGR